MIKIGVIFPSRGLCFSETVEELLRELKPYNHTIYFSHKRPLPECFNEPLEKALKDKKLTHILICEDDMMLPRGVLKKMIGLGVPATALDYPYKKNGDSTLLHDPDGLAIYSGTGFILIERWVLDKMPKPIMRIDLAWDTAIFDGTLTMWPRDVSKIKTYGLHDINLGLVLYTNGIPIVPAAPAGQRKLVRLGKAGDNDGAHVIEELTEVGIDNTTKDEDDDRKIKWLAALSTVKHVQITDKKPDDIKYVDGQAHLKQGGEMIV